MVYLFYIYKLEKKRTLEKKHSPEVNSNHNEEHITNPCGFVTHDLINNFLKSAMNGKGYDICNNP